MDIRIEKEHNFSSVELPVKVCNLIQELEAELHLVAEWRDDYLAVHFRSEGGITKGLKGYLEFDEKKIVLEVDLPFGLKPMRGMVESTIREHMTEYVK